MRRRAAASAALVIALAHVASADVRTRQGQAAGAQLPPLPPPPPPPQLPSAPATAGTSAISGVVVDGSTNQPLTGAVVFLGPAGHGPPDQPLRQVTDAKGRFVFTRLPAYDGYSMSATKLGYFDGQIGRSTAGSLSQRIVLAEGQWLRDVHLVMSRPAAISGVVVDDRGEPIVGAYIRALRQIMVSGQTQLATTPFTTTDDRGAYRIGSLAPGTYYVQMPSVQNAVLASTPTEAIAGRGGRPPELNDPVIDADALHQLVVGRYPIPPRSPDGSVTVYPPTFYPDVAAFNVASTIALTAGQERPGVDLHVAPVRAARISGRVEGPAGAALAGTTLRLLLAGAENFGDGSEAATTLVAADNTFTFLNVPAGAYVIDSRQSVGEFLNGTALTSTNRSLPRTPGVRIGSGGSIGVTSGIPNLTMTYRSEDTGASVWARQPIRTDGRDVANVVVTMKKTSTISGRYAFDFVSTPPSAQIMATIGPVTAQPAHGEASLGIGRARVDPSAPDTFKIEGLPPGEFVLAELLAAIESVVCGSTDYTYRAFDTSTGADFSDCVVTLTDKFAGISGTVRNDRGEIPADAAVIIFPVAPDRWVPLGFTPLWLRGLSVSTSGAYGLSRMAAGEYFVVAVPGEFIAGWQDPAFLRKAAPLATRVHLEVGQKVVQDLMMKAIK